MKLLSRSLLLFGSIAVLSADEIQQAIDEGTAAFEAGEFSEAAGQFDLASQLLREKSGGVVAEAFPEAMDGWEADGEPNVEALAAGFMGGMTTASQSYTETNGSGSINMQIVTDSPMIGQLSMFLSNPAMVRQMGQKIVNVGDGKGIVEFQNGSGTLTQIIENRYLLTVNGDDIEESDLILFAGAVDSSKLSAR